MLRVKICGLTNLADSQAAIQAGANMLGFNFYPFSPRYVTPQACAQFISDLGSQLAQKSIITVGVFVNLAPEAISTILDQCSLDLAQLSGDEPPADLYQIGLNRAFKVVRSDGCKGLSEIALGYPARPVPPAYLVDANVPGHYGGTGKVADWPQAHQLAQSAPVLLAGGLHPDNVADAVRQVAPWGVDVASGVETTPGKKDLGKISAFVQAAQAAYQREQQT